LSGVCFRGASGADMGLLLGVQGGETD
jgi:hypothetical protein